MIWTKGTHQSTKFQTFSCSSKISSNLYFDRLLLLKAYKLSAKKVHRNYVSWPWRVMQNLNKNWFVVSKMTRIWWICPEHSKVSKTCILIGSYCAKYLMFRLKKYRGVIFYETEESFKIWGKADLCFGKWHEEFGKFLPDHSKVSKLGLFDGILLSKVANLWA